MREEDFWRENQKMGGDGWVWTLAVVMLICACRLIRSRFSYSVRVKPDSNSAAVEADDLPSLRTPDIVTDLDLKNLIDSLDEDSDDSWENVIDNYSSSISYKAKCCKPKDGPLKYLSVATFEDCSVEVLTKFYMDCDYRMQWDSTVIQHQLLHVDSNHGTEIGRTIKKFPFLTPREYVLAWKLWQGMDGSFYCFTKECEHPSAPNNKRYIRVAVFRSGWRIRKVPGRNASEVRMVHQEDAGLNVNMAKLAFAKGIWSYMCKMDNALRKYSAGKQHLLNSIAGSSMSVQKVPHELEETSHKVGSAHPENSTATVNLRSGTSRSTKRKDSRRPSKKLIAHCLAIAGGAILLCTGHSSVCAQVGMAYLLNKLKKRAGAA